MCRNYIHFSVKITHIYCFSITQKKCPAHVLPMYIFAVCVKRASGWIFTIAVICYIYNTMLYIDVLYSLTCAEVPSAPETGPVCNMGGQVFF